MNKTSRPRISSRLLVGTQVLASAAIVLSTRPSPTFAIGLSIAVVGIGLGGWAIVVMGVRRVSVMPELHSNARLITTGPYRFVRHPMYTSLLLFAGGLALSPLATWKAIVWFILLAALLSKTVIEERQLHDRFPDYENYARQTKRLIPFLI